MGDLGAWQKLAVLAEDVRKDPALQQIFQEGPAARILKVLHDRGFTADDIRVLSEDVTNMSGLWLSVGSFWMT